MPRSRRICTGEPLAAVRRKAKNYSLSGTLNAINSFGYVPIGRTKKGHEGPQTQPNDSDAKHLPQI